MAQYSIEIERVQTFVTQVEANSEEEARAIVLKFTRSHILGCHSDDGEFELTEVSLMEEQEQDE